MQGQQQQRMIAVVVGQNESDISRVRLQTRKGFLNLQADSHHHNWEVAQMVRTWVDMGHEQILCYSG